MTTATYITAAEAAKTIKANLKARSGKAWSVTSDHGWIAIKTVRAPHTFGQMTLEETQELQALLGLEVSRYRSQYIQVIDTCEARQEYIDRSAGRTPSVYGTRYWD